LQTIKCLFLIDVIDDPVYRCFEVQSVEDVRLGKGLLAILYRHDGLIDVLHERDVYPDREVFMPNLLHCQEISFSGNILETLEYGLRVDISFVDPQDRHIAIRVEDTDSSNRKPCSFLAPISSIFEKPIALLVVYMDDFDFVRRSAKIDLLVDHTARRIATIPLPIDLRRVYLARFASQTSAIFMNRNSDFQHSTDPVALPISVIHPDQHKHRATWSFNPPFPAPHTICSELRGTWKLDVHATTALLAGNYRAWPEHGKLHVELAVTQGWRTRELKFSLKLLTWLMPVFRKWPTTYLWRASFDTDGHPLDLQWLRLGT
jgi:hypothetical protein